MRKSASGTRRTAIAITTEQNVNAMSAPTKQSEADSTRNCVRIEELLAPKLFRMPISFVLSVTDTNMIFMMPMIPTIKESSVRPMPIPQVASRKVSTCSLNVCVSLMEKSSSCPGGTFRIERIKPVASARVSSSFSAEPALTAIDILRPVMP